METSFYNEALNELERSLNTLEVEIHNVVERSEKAIYKCLGTLEMVKDYFKKHQPLQQEEEIAFFKEIKPRFVALSIYYSKLYDIEINLLVACPKSRIKTYRAELNSIKNFFNQNKTFYKYYKTNCTYLDHKYFVKGNHDIQLKLRNNTFELDHSFSTSHDFLAATILAYERLKEYLKKELENKKNRNTDRLKLHLTQNDAVKWTGSKVALVELIYALHSAKVFNNGKSEIKEIAKAVENTFDINLGDYYRAYTEIRLRKTSRTKFLNSLKEELITKMESSDAE